MHRHWTSFKSYSTFALRSGGSQVNRKKADGRGGGLGEVFNCSKYQVHVVEIQYM